MIKRFVPVAILAAGFLVPNHAAAQTLASATATAVASSHQSATERWREDYDRALKQEKAGKIKMYAGLGVLVLGLTVGVRMSSSPDSGSGSQAAAILLDAGGGVLTFWGVREYLGARDSIALLELNRPATGTTASLRLSDHHAIGVGTRTLSYAVSW